MLLEVEGFILSETPYGETSKIINVLTKEKGLIGIMAKGAKSMKSALRASTQVFTYGVFSIYFKDGKLSTLANVDIINPLKSIRSDLTKISYLTYISELTSQVIKQTNEDVFDMFINIVLKMEDNLDPVILTNILELKYLPLLGVGLNLDSCIKCGDKTNIVTIDATYGGLICKDCFQNELIVDKKVIQLIRMYYYVDIKSISSINVKEEYKQIINKFISDYYDSFTGLYVYSKKFLEQLS